MDLGYWKDLLKLKSPLQKYRRYLLKRFNYIVKLLYSKEFDTRKVTQTLDPIQQSCVVAVI